VANCAAVGCAEKVIACFQEIKELETGENSASTYPGLRFCWCERHWDLLKNQIVGMRGKFVRPEDELTSSPPVVEPTDGNA
jgi:hypothetical protein